MSRTPPRVTTKRRVFNRQRQARLRARWRVSGVCVECGKSRKWPTLRCGLCLIGNVIRVDRAVYKKRMAKAEIAEVIDV